ncbi:HesA/MoeB/ThiF family protein [Sphingomonas colocasiae]|uniref:Molybdopterin-synthase adenylyltransferase MoeB n=1 Tax=Sphingomonas colocasiae TaxID=1848973 RepID=A0ABS7PNK9_9SPHN|nr:molybdopterin-synthase adenylyltransferase MoeB [Sphingomonas colocasiae]MBY8822853.1 molybdopterin-synthase adenylyltransferase MoeB [Sphingomonas colocasiae]
MDLTDEELDRYARHIVLKQVGGTGQGLIKKARVTVIGAGGIGCPAIQYLAAAGVGALTIIDDDRVSLANLQRQTLFTTGDVGALKAERAADAVRALNPHVAVTAQVARITAANVAELIVDTDVVLDGCDNFATRLLVSDHCTRVHIPLVSAAIGQFQGQIGTFRGWEAGAPCYRCFVGDAHDPDDCDSCAEQGVLGAMAGMMGSFAAMEAIRLVTGFGPEATGKLHVFDGIAPMMRTIRLPKDPACRTCGQ